MPDTCNWPGASGKHYNYTIYKMDGTWNDVPGNYIFAKRGSSGKWQPVYIGQTESFKDRLPDHNELPCVNRNGATHVHAHVNQSEQARRDEEADLLANFTPPCNG